MKPDLEEHERLEALYRYDILDTPREETFDRMARLARLVMGTRAAELMLVDSERVWCKAAAGIAARERPRRRSFCDYAIQGNVPLVIRDAAADARYNGKPFVVGERRVRFYCGVPLATPDGFNIGTLCATDEEPGDATLEQIEGLRDLARMVVDELELRRLASTDSLTGVLSLRSFATELKRGASLARRHRRDLGIIVFDLDELPSIGDRLGQAACDSAMRSVIKLCTQEIRATDILGRLGDEEFAVALPETGLEEAATVAERLRLKIEQLRFPEHSLGFKVTASFGVAMLQGQDRGFEQALERAYAAMQDVKCNGRNRVAVAPLRPLPAHLKAAS